MDNWTKYLSTQKWTKKADIKVGQILKSGVFVNAKVLRISNNGWVQLKWPDGRKFSVRVHWLSLHG